MLFVVMGYFNGGAEAKRTEIHERFNEHLMQRATPVRFGGPLYSDTGERSGVLLVVEAADRKAAEAFINASPYQAAGLYARTEIMEIRPEINHLS